MTFRIGYANGAVEEVPRCFLYEAKGANDAWTKRWLVQRTTGEKVVLRLEEISSLQFRPEGVPEAWLPAPQFPR